MDENLETIEEVHHFGNMVARYDDLPYRLRQKIIVMFMGIAIVLLGVVNFDLDHEHGWLAIFFLVFGGFLMFLATIGRNGREIIVYDEGIVSIGIRYKLTKKAGENSKDEVYFSEFAEVYHHGESSSFGGPPTYCGCILLKGKSKEISFHLYNKKSWTFLRELAGTYSAWLFRDQTDESIRLKHMHFGKQLQLKNGTFFYKGNERVIPLIDIDRVIVEKSFVYFENSKGETLLKLRSSKVSNPYVLSYLVEKSK